MKKSFFSTLLFMAISIKGVFASNDSTFYTGFMSGYDFSKARLQTKEILHDNEPFTRNDSLSLQGATSEIILGTNKFFDSFLLGTETSLAADYGTAYQVTASPGQMINQSFVTVSKIRKKNSLKLAMRGGYLFSDDHIFYVAFGAIKSRYTLELISHNGEHTYAKITSSLWAPLIAIGTEIKLTNSLSGRLEFSHIRYCEKKIGFMNGAGPGKLRFKPQSNKITLGVIIKIF